MKNDELIVGIVLSDKMTKSAQDMSSLTTSIKDYVSNHIDENDVSGSVINLIAPGAIWVLFNAFGKGWIGTLIGLCINIFKIDVKGILKSLHSSFKSMIPSGNITDSKIESAVKDAVKQNTKKLTEDDQESIPSVEATTSDARMIKLAMIAYQNKTAGLFSLFSSRQGEASNILVKVLTWLFKTIFASAGLMIGADVVNKGIGAPSGFDGPVARTQLPSKPESTIKYKLNKSYYQTAEPQPWTESYNNSREGISNMLLDFANEVYELNGKDNEIEMLPAFKAILNEILKYNAAGKYGNVVMLPFKSKKQLVDFFMKDLK